MSYGTLFPLHFFLLIYFFLIQGVENNVEIS